MHLADNVSNALNVFFIVLWYTKYKEADEEFVNMKTFLYQYLLYL